MNIEGFTNQQAVEVLRRTGQTVCLKLRPGFRPDETIPSIMPDIMETKPVMDSVHGNDLNRPLMTCERFRAEKEQSVCP